MKIALIGTGRTGSKVFDIAGQHEVVGFDKTNPPTRNAIQACDVVISFLTGEVMAEYVDLLVASGKPVASGATSIDWPDGLHEQLLKNKVSWVTSSNFAIGMNLVRSMIKTLGKATALFDDAQFALHEIHHVGKKDAPSGTALSWQDWLGSAVRFEDERIGDTVGDHTLTLETQYEQISIQHIAKDRKIFATGAVWTAERLVRGDFEPGLHRLEEVMQKEIEA